MSQYTNFQIIRYMTQHNIFKEYVSKIMTKLEEHSTEVHNSRRPLNRLIVTLTLTLTLTFDLIFIDGRGIVMD